MSDSTDLASNARAISQIKNSADAGKLVAVIGTGVSMALTSGKRPDLSWKGLIANGFEYGITKGTISETQKVSWKHQLNSDDIDEILSAAEFMGRKLDAPNGILYARWLENVFKEVTADKNEMAEAIRALQAVRVPICTLNYDPLLERVTGLPGITLEETPKVTSWMRRESQAILHLHGSWDAPATCILGIRDYETTVSDEVRNLIQRTLSSFSRLLFIGCGDTFVDPNFSALIKWLRERLKTATPQHYAAVNDAEAIRRHADPSWHGFVDPISYGPTHNDLPAFLLKNFPIVEVSEGHPISISLAAPDRDRGIRCIDDYEPKPQIFGRDDEIELIVNALLEGRTALIAGGPGMGKTAIATAAFYDPRVVTRFGCRRVFALLETAIEPRAILARLVEALGLPPTGDEVSLLRIVEANAAEKPFAAILDNAETVFDAERSTAERLLKLLVQIKGLSLAVTIRGVAPPIPGATLIDDLAKLGRDAALDAFLAITGRSFRSDSDLPHLLEALDGHALSIRLIAAQAIGSASLKGLRESWDEVHAEILRISDEEEGRLTSVRASLNLSLNSRRMKATPLARRLLSLLAHLPGGLAESDVASLLGERGTLTKAKANDAVACLRQLRLVEQRPDQRLRMLTPLRECAKSSVQFLDIDRNRAIERYLLLAEKGGTIGSKAWDRNHEAVEAEADNLDSMCELAIRNNQNHKRLRDALYGLAEFHRFSGKGTIEAINLAIIRLRARRTRPTSDALQDYVRWLGEIALLRSDNIAARLYLEEALSLYRAAGDKWSEATCLCSLAQIAYHQADTETSSALFEEARHLYRRIERKLGQANCTLGLARIALGRYDSEKAHALVEDGRALYRQIGEVKGIADCLTVLAAIAARRYDYGNARSFLEESRILHRNVGSAGEEANCILDLGYIALDLSDDTIASRYFQDALTQYQRTGDVLGEANCRVGFATIALHKLELDRARSSFEEAWQLFKRIGAAGSESACIVGLAHVARYRCDYEMARALFEEAVVLDRKIDQTGKTQATCSYGQGILSILMNDPEGACSHFENARELSRKLNRHIAEAQAMVRCGQLQRSGNAEQGAVKIEEGFSLFFRYADRDDLALAGWKEMHRSLGSVDGSEAQMHRDAAKSSWTAIERFDLVADWIDLT